MMLTKHIFDYDPILEKSQTGGVGFSRGDQEKIIWIFHWSWIFGLDIYKGCSTNLRNFQG